MTLNPLADLIDRIQPLDVTASAAAEARHLQLTKPPGSLGRLESLAIQIAGITGAERPRLPRKAVIVMAADHGVTAQGVSAYPADVTAQMVANFLHGGAAINVLARRAGARVVVVDAGVKTPLPPHPDLISKRIGPGTRDFTTGPAMSLEQALEAIQAGVDVVNAEIARGLDAVATGDMGIGNTTSSSAIVAAFGLAPAKDVTGRGTGIDDEGLKRKISAIERGLAVNRPDPNDPLDVLAKVGGFEIAGLTGVILGAAAARLPVVVDGFISGAAALVAVKIAPNARDYLIAAHKSVEIGHHIILEHLRMRPFLDLGLRLGEGTGAAIALHLVDDALAILDEMATFEEAGVAGKTE